MINVQKELFSFRPKARLLRTLGEELISNESVAIIELVKNAYDADANKVLIQFSEEQSKGHGNLEIIDDGHGMSMSIVENAWMQPATNNKRKQTHSNILKRRMLGEKGIGRFASARIAGELELVTREIGTENEIYALFDWSQFENEDTYLDEITVLAEQRRPEEIRMGGTIDKLWTKRELTDSTERNHGTILRMSKFKKTWTTDDFQELQRGLSRLISPFSQLENFKIIQEGLCQNQQLYVCAVPRVFTTHFSVPTTRKQWLGKSCYLLAFFRTAKFRRTVSRLVSLQSKKRAWTSCIFVKSIWPTRCYF